MKTLFQSILNKKIIFILQFIISIIAFVIGYTMNVERNNSPISMDVLLLPKSEFILKICTHNYVLSVLQAVFSFFSFGVLGVWFLFSTFFIYGFALKYAKNIFVLFEIVGSLLSIVFATSLSFKVLGNDLKINPHFIKILLYLVINLFVFFIAAWLEWDFIFG